MMDPKTQKPSRTSPSALQPTGQPAGLGIDALKELALNLHWSWNHAADELWEASG